MSSIDWITPGTRPGETQGSIVSSLMSHEELVKFTWLTRNRSAYLTDRYSERVESAEELSRRVNQNTH